MCKDQRHSFKPLEDWIKCKMNPSSKLIENYKGKWALFHSYRKLLISFLYLFLVLILENIEVWQWDKFWHMPKPETILNVSAYTKVTCYRTDRSMITQDIFHLR